MKRKGQGVWRTIWAAAMLLCVALCLYPVVSMAAPAVAASGELSSLFRDGWAWFNEHTHVQGSVLAYAVGQRAREGSQNPRNLIVNAPRFVGAAEVRPDGFGRWGIVEAAIKPRWHLEKAYWDEGRQPQSWDGDSEVFVNEWWLRLHPHPDFTVSYGRENLQWGPAYFLSPTNPFFRDNGKANPKDEVDGMDFFQASWTPSPSWTVTVMVNTDEGRQDWIRDFERTYALKVDWTGYRRYVSLVVSKREDRRAHWGGYAGVTATDALLLYGEIDVTSGSPGLYPVHDEASPFGVSMTASRETSERLMPMALLGASYTLEAGPTLVAEYLYHRAGYSNPEAEDFFALSDRAAAAFGQANPLGAAAAQVLGAMVDPGLRLLRQHYLLLQYQHRDLWRKLDIVLRTVINLDDASVRLNPIVEMDLGDRFRWFLVGAKTVGSDWGGLRQASDPNRTEFRRLGDYSFWTGLEFFF